MSSPIKLKASQSSLFNRGQILSACRALVFPVWGGSAFAADRPWLEMETTTDVASHNSLYADTTVTIAPLTSLYESGWRLRFTGSYNQYDLTDPKHTARDRSAQALVGYVFATESASVMLGGGLVINRQEESGVNTTKTGGKFIISAYARPSDTTMLYGQVNYSSPTEFRLAQGKFGLKVLPDIFVGPEASISGGKDFTQGRLGAHLTGFSVLRVNGGVSAGVLRDSNNGNGFYSTLTLRVNM